MWWDLMVLPMLNAGSTPTQSIGNIRKALQLTTAKILRFRKFMDLAERLMVPLAIEHRPLASLIPYARNARTHSPEQVAEIAASIQEFGWTNPVLVDGESGIIAGHGRVLAAKRLGIDPVPCIELAGLSEAQRRAYILAESLLQSAAGQHPRS